MLASLVVAAVVAGVAFGAAAWWVFRALGDTLQAIDDWRDG